MSAALITFLRQVTILRSLSYKFCLIMLIAMLLSKQASSFSTGAIVKNRFQVGNVRIFRRQPSAFPHYCSTSSFSKTTVGELELLVRNALIKSFGDKLGASLDTSGVCLDDVDPQIFLGKGGFGDYQCNVAMPLAKRLKLKPREIADSIIQHVIYEDDKIKPMLKSLDVSGPGFINLHLSEQYAARKATFMLATSSEPVDIAVDAISLSKYHLGVKKADSPQRIVVDFSSPNIAKEMHVGHLRSTIIGDCLSRVLQYQGHEVLRLNHVGDWGTQFGMLIHYLKTLHSGASDGQVAIGDLVEFYKAAKLKFDADEEFKELSRLEVVRLQQGDPNSLEAWQQICETSRVEFRQIYDRLSISGELIERGESFYNPMLQPICEQLKTGGFAKESDGALCVFIDGYSNADGTPLPLIIQKSDGGYLYATTDLAALQHRVVSERADRIIYVTDSGQSQHFRMVFEAARLTGILPLDKNVSVEHVPFGLVQGEDGKKIKSRAGDSIKLRELLDEAVRIASEQFAARDEFSFNSGIESQQVDELSNKDRARIMGIAAVKYADLSMNRESNYKFSFNKMLALSGNTAPYMLYAYVRIRGIQRKAVEAVTTADQSSSSSRMNEETLQLVHPAEIALTKHLIRFDEVIEELARDLYPNKMCDYIFELSQKFNQFYENCPVLRAETPQLLRSRSLICTLTADILKTSLDLLGIETLEQL